MYGTSQRIVETGEATEDTYDEMCNIENSTRERKQGFIERTPKYYPNPEIMFEWCENLGTHLLKGSDRLCKVVELSMQCCRKLL